MVHPVHRDPVMFCYPRLPVPAILCVGCELHLDPYLGHPGCEPGLPDHPSDRKDPQRLVHDPAPSVLYDHIHVQSAETVTTRCQTTSHTIHCAMKAAIRLFLILVTLVVIIFAWMTHQLGTPGIQLLIVLLVAFTLAVFLVLNLLDHRENSLRRRDREALRGPSSGSAGLGQKRSDTSFRLRDRKAGLTWGGGNIKASEATRGTRRKFLGK